MLQMRKDAVCTGIKKGLKEAYHRIYPTLLNSFLCKPLYYLVDCLGVIRASFMGKPDISYEDRRNVQENVTFIFKSFNRHKLAKRLYDRIISYYPNVRVIIADDSREPLDLPCVIHLPFNSGISKGLNAALEQVQTPYVMRLDDDELLTPGSKIHDQLRYLQTHPQVDLVGIQPVKNAKKSAASYGSVTMKKPLLIPAGTDIDGKTVVYKTPNIFLARTDKIRQLGYDPNIRMLDHHEFFNRAAGVLVCVQDAEAYVLHLHNMFDKDYSRYRTDYDDDMLYIRNKQNS